MDDFVKEKLRAWNLEKYIKTFMENEISKENFHLLTKDSIAELLPKIGPRTLFMTELKKFQDITENNNEAAGSSLVPLSKFQRNSQEEKQNVPLYTTDIRKLLLSTEDGKYILEMLDAGTSLDFPHRKTMIKILSEDILRAYGACMSTEVKKHLIKAILDAFPNLYSKENTDLKAITGQSGHIEEYRSANDMVESIINDKILQKELLQPASFAPIYPATTEVIQTNQTSQIECQQLIYSVSEQCSKATEYSSSSSSNTLVSHNEAEVSSSSAGLALISHEEPIIKQEPLSEAESLDFYVDPIVRKKDTSFRSSSTVNTNTKKSNDTTVVTSTQNSSNFDVRKVLSKTDTGKRLLDVLDRQHITTDYKHLMTRLLVAELIDRYGPYPPREVKEQVAASIVEQFPFLQDKKGGHEEWYSKSNNNGFLEDRLRYHRKRFCKRNMQDSDDESTKQSKKSKSTDKSSHSRISNPTNNLKTQAVCDKVINEPKKEEPKKDEPKNTSNDKEIPCYIIVDDDEIPESTTDNRNEDYESPDEMTVVAYEDYMKLKLENEQLKKDLQKEKRSKHKSHSTKKKKKEPKPPVVENQTKQKESVYDGSVNDIESTPSNSVVANDFESTNQRTSHRYSLYRNYNGQGCQPIQQSESDQYQCDQPIRKRGRPKGSKNKVNWTMQKRVLPGGKRGRPKGSKNKVRWNQQKKLLYGQPTGSEDRVKRNLLKRGLSPEESVSNLEKAGSVTSVVLKNETTELLQTAIAMCCQKTAI